MLRVSFTAYAVRTTCSRKPALGPLKPWKTAGPGLDLGLGLRYVFATNSLNRNNPPPLMTKRDLVLRISEETGLVQQQVLQIVQQTLDYITEALARGETVELRNFGVFEVKVRKARIGRNPNAPATDVPIPPRAIVKFKAGKEMRETVIKLSPSTGNPPAKPSARG